LSFCVTLKKAITKNENLRKTNNLFKKKQCTDISRIERQYDSATVAPPTLAEIANKKPLKNTHYGNYYLRHCIYNRKKLYPITPQNLLKSLDLAVYIENG
jgi:hypothetical protein